LRRRLIHKITEGTCLKLLDLPNIHPLLSIRQMSRAICIARQVRKSLFMAAEGHPH